MRYDGGHKHNRYVTKILGKLFEFVPICPEVAIGLGTPRPSVRLVADVETPRAVASKKPDLDVTERLERYGASTVKTCRPLSGYIFKRGSPSCGMERVNVETPFSPLPRCLHGASGLSGSTP